MTSSADTRVGDLVVWTGRPTAAYYPPATCDGPRGRDTFEFLWVLAGVAEWERAGRRCVLAPGTMALLRPGLRHRLDWDQRRPTRVGYVAFGLDQDRSGFDPEGWPEVRTTGRDDPVRGLTRYLLWLDGRQPVGWRRRVDEVVAMLVTVFVDGPLPDEGNGPDLPAALEPVLDHVRTVWAAGPLRPLTRTELARAGAMSSGHLSRLFREHCGVGAIAAFESVRLMRAENLLRRSTMSVRSVAAACGFADAYHFSHRFKATYGVSPRAFRDGAGDWQASADGASTVRLLAHRIWGMSGPMVPPSAHH